MLAHRNIDDIPLPEKTLCLTYDDGPGPASAELGRFLADRGIRATFFVVGKFALTRPEVLDELHAQGHIIGNHTFEHPDLPYYVSVDGDVRDQLIRTNILIEKYNRNKPVYFRATYGKWSPEVAREVNRDPRCSYMHVGPVFWDIDGVDCYFWQLGKSVEEAEAAYLEAINHRGRGIVVMHDGVADMDTVALRSQTLELTRRLVPKLQDAGYNFVGLDEIDDRQLKDALGDTVAWRSPGGAFLKVREAPDARVDWSGRSASEASAQFRIERGEDGKSMLRTPDGRYLRVDAARDDTVQLAGGADMHALFDMIPVSAGQFMLRSSNGNYLAAATAQGGPLKASAPYMRQAGCFDCVSPKAAYIKPLGLAKRLAHARKRLQFVKSKLLRG